MTVTLAARPRLNVQLGHSHWIASVAFSPDGLSVATGGDDGTARLWETATGREIRRFGKHSEGNPSIVFSPNGRRILTGGEDGTLRLWDTNTGREVRRFEGHSDWISAAAFSPTGYWILTGSLDGTVRLWETTTGREVRRFGRKRGPIFSVVFSPDGQWVLTGGEDGILRLWETSTGRKVSHFKGYPDRIASVAFSPDGQQVLTGGGDGVVRLWEMDTGQKLRRFGGHSKGISAVAFSPDGQQVLSSGLDGWMRLWQKDSGREVRRFGKHPGWVDDVAFSPDGRWILVGTSGGAWLWETATGRKVRRFEGLSAGVTSVALSPDGHWIVVGGLNGTTQLWDTVAGREMRRFEGHSDWVLSVTISPDGRRVATGSEDGTLRLWEMSTGRELHRLDGHSQAVTSVVFSPDGHWVLTGSVDKTVRLWESATGREVRRFEGHSDEVNSVAFSPDGQRVLTGGRDGTLRLWETNTGSELRRIGGQGRPITTVAFSPDGNQVLASDSNAVSLWQTDADPIRVQGHSDEISATNFSPDGRWVLTGSWDGTARLWETATGLEIRRFEGHTVGVTSVAIWPDGRWVLTGSEDGTARVWETATGREVARLISFRDGAWAVVAPDGRYDSNRPGDLPGLSWVMPDDPMSPLPVEIFMRDYFEPRLLPRLLAGENFPPIPSLLERNRAQPLVEILEVSSRTDDPGRVDVRVEVAGNRKTFERDGQHIVQGTGVNDLQLFRDRQLVAQIPDHGGPIELDRTNGKQIVTFENIRLPRREGRRTVDFTAYAFNDDRVKSATSQYSFELPQDLKPLLGRAYVVSIGINAHQNPAWDLKYAAADARVLNATLVSELEETGQYEAVVPVLLIADRPAGERQPATKALIKAVFALLAGREAPAALRAQIPNAEHIAPARPEDLLVVSYAGHGYAQSNGIFHLFPYDIGTGFMRTVSEELLRRTVTSDDLSRWLRTVDAGDVLMIVDACYSAASVATPGFKPGPMGSRGFGQLAYDKGMRLLAASQAESVALESRLVRHGLLTYALVREGIEGARADWRPQDRQILAGEWLSYGAARVPELSAEIRTGRFEARGVKAYVDPEGEDQRVAEVQQPGLFDFTRRKTEVVLSRVREP